MVAVALEREDFPVGFGNDEAHLGSLEADDLFASSANPDRHGSLDTLCGRLHALLIGRAAAAVLAAAETDPDLIPEEAGLWAATSWAWLHPRVNVGRKSRAASGKPLRLPVRIDWEQGPLTFIAPGERQAHAWIAAGLGHTGSDTVMVGASQTLLEPVITAEASAIPTEVTVPLVPRPVLLHELHDLVVAGEQAKWEVVRYLEPYVTKALHVAHSNVAHELATQFGSHTTLLDETKLESIRDRMLLGDESHPGKVHQLLDLCLKPETFRKVDPLLYIRDYLRYNSNSEIRKALGDPHIGPKIRKVAQELGVRDIDAIVEEYRARYPKDRLSYERALAAFSVAPDPMAGWADLFDLHPETLG